MAESFGAAQSVKERSLLCSCKQCTLLPGAKFGKPSDQALNGVVLEHENSEIGKYSASSVDSLHGMLAGVEFGV
jgi:hypothetical protein